MLKHFHLMPRMRQWVIFIEPSSHIHRPIEFGFEEQQRKKEWKSAKRESLSLPVYALVRFDYYEYRKIKKKGKHIVLNNVRSIQFRMFDEFSTHANVVCCLQKQYLLSMCGYFRPYGMWYSTKRKSPQKPRHIVYVWQAKDCGVCVCPKSNTKG